MSNKFPVSNTAQEIGDGFTLEMPVARKKNNNVVDKTENTEDNVGQNKTRTDGKGQGSEQTTSVSTQNKDENKVETANQRKTKAVDQEAIQDKPVKSPKKPMKIMTYIGEDDYDDFTEVADALKRSIRKETNKKLKETHISELMIRLSVAEYNRDKNAYLTKVREIMGEIG